jgi:hypothetical protein
MHITFINNTTHTGNTFITSYDDSIYLSGPIIERNGGTAEMTATVGDTTLSIPGLALLDGMFLYCINGNGNVLLNPSLYKGDMITITFTSLGQGFFGVLQCTCSGSACDISMSPAKKTI